MTVRETGQERKTTCRSVGWAVGAHPMATHEPVGGQATAVTSCKSSDVNGDPGNGALGTWRSLHVDPPS